jgi:hypothetical protein
MTAAASWEPGEPFLPDNGCGSIPVINWTEQQRQAAVDEDDTPPPWYRPHNTVAIEPGYVRYCGPCDVSWRGDLPCWACGGDNQP